MLFYFNNLVLEILDLYVEKGDKNNLTTTLSSSERCRDIRLHEYCREVGSLAWRLMYYCFPGDSLPCNRLLTGAAGQQLL